MRSYKDHAIVALKSCLGPQAGADMGKWKASCTLLVAKLNTQPPTACLEQNPMQVR